MYRERKNQEIGYVLPSHNMHTFIRIISSRTGPDISNRTPRMRNTDTTCPDFNVLEVTSWSGEQREPENQMTFPRIEMQPKSVIRSTATWR